MKKCFVIFLLCISFSCKNFAQFNAAHSRISILTCAPGDELYELFGHTAIRIYDSATKLDVVYNWGGFTFDQPNFYLNFVRGSLLYFSIANYFNDFIEEYTEGNRNVYEQVLNIDSTSKKDIIDAVIFNSTGDNKFYKYDGFTDNCTTRIKNIVFNNLKKANIVKSIIPEGTTSRDLMHYYLERGNHLWSELGLDILLGKMIDKKVSNNAAMFLPEFFMKGLSNTTYESNALVANFKTIYQGSSQQKQTWKYWPLLVTAFTCILLFLISTLKKTWSQKFISFVDALLLYVTGLLGILLLIMWFATDHIECKNNFNIAWALPTNLIVAFCLIKKPLWLQKYFFVVTIITALLIATWFWLPQQLNIAILPFVIYLLSRYSRLAINYKKI